MTFRYFRMPSVCVFGSGASSTAGEELRKLGATSALIVSDSSMTRLGRVARLAEHLAKAGVRSAVFDKVDTEPTDGFVSFGVGLLAAAQCDSLVAIGGGSPIDTAKAIGIVAANGGQIADYMGIGQVPKRPRPRQRAVLHRAEDRHQPVVRRDRPGEEDDEHLTSAVREQIASRRPSL
jgi:alcohol dehydrogenase class IV